LYDFIFVVYLRLCEKVRTVDPLDNATTFIGLTIFFHIFFVANLFTFLTSINVLASVFGKNHSKYFWLPFVVAFMIFIYRFYKRRSAAIVRKYSERQDVLSWQNIVFALVMTIAPLLLGIYFLNIDPA
jgi:hypothetical protein